MTRRLRPSRLPLLVVGTVLTATALTGCGFNYATDRVNTISAGVNDRSGTVDVLGAVVIAEEDGTGVFAATLVNKNLDARDLLQTVGTTTEAEAPLPDAPAEEDTEGVATVQTLDAGPVNKRVDAGGQNNLFVTGAIPVIGDFGAGDFVEVTLTFLSGQESVMTVPVVVPCRQYLPELHPGVETAFDAIAAEGETPIDPGDGTGEVEEGVEAAEEEAESAEEEVEEGHEGDYLPEPYSCDQATVKVGHGE